MKLVRPPQPQESSEGPFCPIMGFQVLAIPRGVPGMAGATSLDVSIIPGPCTKEKCIFYVDPPEPGIGTLVTTPGCGLRGLLSRLALTLSAKD